jgi:hypothetical protein
VHFKELTCFENGSVQADGGADRRRPITGEFEILKSTLKIFYE